MKARMFFVITMDTFKMVQWGIVFAVFLTGSFVSGFVLGKGAIEKAKPQIAADPIVASVAATPESHFLETSTQKDEEEERAAISLASQKETKLIYALDIEGFPTKRSATESMEKWKKEAPGKIETAKIFRKRGFYQIRVTLSENREEAEKLKKSLPNELFKRSKVLSFPTNS